VTVNQAPAESDADLWASVRRGDSAAFERVYQRHADAIFNYAFRRTSSWAHAEDVTSMVFLEAWRRRNDTELTTQLVLPWLYGIANNICRRQWRTLMRFQRMLAKLPKDQAEPDPADAVVSRLEDERRMRAALEAVRDLSLDEQDVIALCVWSGLGYAEAAVALGVPIGTIRSRLSRARQKLRRETTTMEEEQ
jgi:RNA polymerase sigma factor (sigma-70 family)